MECPLTGCTSAWGTLTNHYFKEELWMKSSALDFILETWFRQAFSSAVHTLFLLLILIPLIQKRIKRWKLLFKQEMRPIHANGTVPFDDHHHHAIRINGRFKTSLFSCLVLCLVYLTIVCWCAISGWIKGWSNAIFLDIGGLTVQGVAWFSMFLTTFNTRTEQKVTFPWQLRLWWIFSFLLSCFNLSLDIMFLEQGFNLQPEFWVDAICFLICMYLCAVALLGKSGLEIEKDGVQEPLLGSECSKKKKQTNHNLTLYANAGIFSVMFFCWLDPLLSLGYKKAIELDDIPQLAEEDRAETTYRPLKLNWDKTKASDSPSIVKAIVRTFWKGVAVNACFALVYTISSYVGPYLIDDFVEYLSGERSFPYEGYILAAIFLGAKIVESLTLRQWYFGAQLWSMRVKASLTALIYNKGLCLSSQSRKNHTSGEIINYMSVDVQRIGDFSWYLHDTWMLPIQILLALFVLYTNLGWASLSALGATALTMLMNLPLARKMERFQDKIMQSKDVRMKATSEVLRSMKVLKLQAWEIRFQKRLEGLRRVEYGWLRNYLLMQSSVTTLFWGAPTFVAVVTFTTCALLGVPLTAGKVLSALATFRILQGPIYNLPDLISMLAQTKVSLERISKFLQEEELQEDAIDRSERSCGSDGVAIELKKASFSWDLSSSKIPTLENLDLEVRRGMRVAVCGMVGSGKSSLLSCLLGDIPRIAGTARVSGSRAYVSQSAWIQSGKIQDIILFGSPMNREKYENILRICTLTKDIELFSHGDQTEIGERGINLSGGQKQRIQLARALYQEADLYLLDDPFSAVDAHTGAQLFKDCILGALARKTVVYVTHQIEFLPAADLILVLREGKIVEAGKYGELLESGTYFNILVRAHTKALESIDILENSGLSMEGSEEKAMNQKESDTGAIQSNGEISYLLMRKNSKEEETDIEKKSAQIVQDEERETGKVGFKVYWAYITTAYKGALIPIILLCQITFQCLQIGSNYWMAWATPATNDQTLFISTTRLLVVFIILALGSVLCILVRAFLVSIVAIATAQKFFLSMLQCMFRAPMSFFDSTPAGRILNRVSTDQSALDMEIPFRLGGLVFSTIQLLGIIAVMSQVAWQVFVLFFPVLAVSIWLQRYYIESARELARLVGIRKSPLIHHFSESISGVATIRGFDQEKRFMEANLLFNDQYSRPSFYSFGAMEWLCIRLDLLTNFVFAFSLVLLVLLPRHAVDASIAGLAVTYGLNLNMLQAWVIWNLCNVESKIISLERIQQYISIPNEAPPYIPNCQPPQNWPFEGTICLHELQVRYGPHMPMVLDGISCTFSGGKKIGVVGRTGSGKSTLIQALFRIVEPAFGTIVIDGIDITTMGLHSLRSRLSIIPQDPTMFEGTVRTNLDPLEEHTDAEIWEALDKSQLRTVVEEKEQKLNAPVIENGDNWSVGQRQLICLARVLLRRTKIFVLDEATASVDTLTDSIIQSTIRTEFENCTVITIAHRIPTVIDSDSVLVLSDGKIAEYDSPGILLEDGSSLFAKLVSEYSTRSTSVSNLTTLE